MIHFVLYDFWLNNRHVGPAITDQSPSLTKIAEFDVVPCNFAVGKILRSFW